MHRRPPTPILLLAALAALGALTGCGSEEVDLGGGAGSTTSTTPAAAGGSPEPAGGGTLAVSLEEVEGIFTEGFEVGLRFEDGSGEVIAATSWSDAVGPGADLDDTYGYVLEQPVPAGRVVVLAEVNVGIGPPPEVPDLTGDLPCRLPVEVGDGERVAVEVSFSGDGGCLRLLDDPASG